MKIGDNLSILEELEASGRVVKALQDSPPYPKEYQYYYDLFIKLHRCRSVGMSSYNPISVQDIGAMCQYSDYDFEDVFDIITGIDEIYRQTISEVSDKDGK